MRGQRALALTKRLLTARRLPVAVAALAVALSLPSLWLGLQLDDMKNKRLLIWLAGSLFVCACSAALYGGGRSTSSADQIQMPGGGARPAAEVEAAVLSTFRKANVKAAAVGVLSDRGLVFARTVGIRIGGSGDPADDDTVFRAASLSKPVFAYLVLTLVKDGRLDLDRPLHEYLPKSLPQYVEYADLAGDSRYEAITARLVLTHRTGFPNWRWQSPDRKLRFLFDPGTKFSYSGEGYKYLQFVIEQMTGSDLETLAGQRVFAPLGMSRTSFVWRAAYAGNGAIDKAAIEKIFGAGFLALPNAAGSLLTTARDYGRFLAAVLAGTGCRPACVTRCSGRTSPSPPTDCSGRQRPAVPPRAARARRSGVSGGEVSRTVPTLPASMSATTHPSTPTTPSSTQEGGWVSSS